MRGTSPQPRRLALARVFWLAPVLWLGLVGGIALGAGLFTLAPIDKTEALQIGVAQEMLRLGEWVVPHWNGHLYAEKPPLPYWLAMLLWQRLGPGPELARLPSVAAAGVGVAAIAGLLWRQSQPQEGPAEAWWRAGLGGTVLALSPGWIAFAHVAVHDIHLAVAISLALLAYAIGFSGPAPPRLRRLCALGIGLGCGLGFLAKGLLGIALPLLTMAADTALQPRRGGPPGQGGLWRPAPLLLLGGGLTLVVGPWLGALITGRQWAYLQGFLGFSHLQRATQAVDGHSEGPLFYLPVLLALLTPWWPLLLAGLGQAWRRWRRGQAAGGGLERLQQLAAVWFLSGLLVFSLIPTKLPGYVLPLLPAAALVIATAAPPPRWSVRLAALQLLLLSAALLVALAIARGGGLGPYGQQLLAPAGALARLAALAVLALLAAAWGWRQAGRSRALPALALSLLLLVSGLPALAVPYRELTQQPLQELARQARQAGEPDQALYVIGAPLYSVVPEAQRPTIFGSPLREPAPRPVSSHRNWLRHRSDPSALVLGPCRSLQKLAQPPARELRLIGRRGDSCLADLRRRQAP